MLSLVLMLGLVAQPGHSRCEHDLKHYRIVTDEGFHVTVNGWIEAGGKTVGWHPNDPFNVKAVENAKGSLESRSSRNYAVNGVQRKTKREETYTLPSEEAREFVADIDPNKVRMAGGDSARLVHVTVVGSESQRSAVIDDIDKLPEFAGIREHLLVQGYNPGEWAVDPALGFQPGSPAIFVQLGKSESDPAGGKVIYRAADYSAGPRPIIEAIRKANPSYKPELDPGVATDIQLPFGLTKADGAISAAIAVLVMLMFGSRKE